MCNAVAIFRINPLTWNNCCNSWSDWWFQTFVISHNIWHKPSNWLIFFRGVKAPTSDHSPRIVVKLLKSPASFNLNISISNNPTELVSSTNLKSINLPGLVNVYKKRTGKIHHFWWINPLFRLGHFQCRKLWVISRGYIILNPIKIPLKSHSTTIKFYFWWLDPIKPP